MQKLPDLVLGVLESPVTFLAFFPDPVTFLGLSDCVGKVDLGDQAEPQTDGGSPVAENGG